MIKDNPWAHHNAKEYEWIRSEDSLIDSEKKSKPDRVFKHCAYSDVKKEPVYSLEDSQEPEGFQDIAVFTSVEGKDFEIAKRLVDLEGKKRWNVGDWLTLHIRGCCNIVKIVEE